MRARQLMNEWHVAQWFNTPRPISPFDLRGRVVLIHAFQMLCPGCVSHGLPQAVRIREAFPEEDLAVIGLHTVFENHEAMQPHALAAFIREYRLRFPIGVDEPSGRSDIPRTMSQLRLQGTPSIVLLDRQGRLRLNHFGMLDDLRLGVMLGQLSEESDVRPLRKPAGGTDAGCRDEGSGSHCRAGPMRQSLPSDLRMQRHSPRPSRCRMQVAGRRSQVAGRGGAAPFGPAICFALVLAMNDENRSGLDERNRFLVVLDDATRPLEEPELITRTAATLLGQYLHVNRCAYADVEADQDTFNLTGDYNFDVPSIVGRYTFSQFGAECLRLMRAGEPYIVTDSESDARTESVRDSYRATRIRSVICVSVLKAGRFTGAMAVHQAQPRQWTRDEVELVQLVASRCWESIERTRVTRELRAMERHLRMAQRAGRVGTFEWDLVSGVVYWSPELDALYGRPAGSFPGNLSAWASYCEPADAAVVMRQMEQKLADREEDFDYEFRAVLPDGRHRWLRGQAQFEYEADGRPLRMRGVNVDIDEQKRLLAAETHARGEAERASALKDEFLATLSHELRTPLNAIVGWTHVLAANGGDQSLLSEGLAVIGRNARAQAQIIDDLLDMNRIMSGRLRLEVRPTLLADVLNDSLDSVRPSAQAKDIRVTRTFDERAGPVAADPTRLQQVFWNLLSNAIKFTPRGGRVQVALERGDSHLEISVSDTGEGIAPEFLPHVFDRFRQFDGSTTRRHGGLGLGLAISRQLVELHGGTLRARSAGVGQGSSFVVTLPISSPVAEAESDVRAERASPETASFDCISLEGLRVLLVDDEGDTRTVLRRVLEGCKARVTEAASVPEALASLELDEFDVLISDIGMPGQDGYNLIQQVRQRHSGSALPALALTAYARAEDRVRALLSGFQMHVPKPVEPLELIALVASLGSRQMKK